MTTAERIKELKQKIKHIKKTSKGGADFRKLIRLQALLAYYHGGTVLHKFTAQINEI